MDLNLKRNLETVIEAKLPRTKKAWIKRTLTFIGLNLSSLSRRERNDLVEWATYLSLEGFPLFVFFPASINRKNHLLPWPKNRPTWLHERVGLVDTRLEEIQTSLRSVIEAIDNLLCNGFSGTEYVDLFEGPCKLALERDHFEEKKFTGTFEMRSFPKADEDVIAWARRNFATLLKGLPFHSITKCKGCGCYFTNLSKRDKVYCNSSCASRSIARIKREKLYSNPKKHEAYKKKMRELMKKRYEKMRRDQFGPNVRIQHRSRKIKKPIQSA